MRRAPLVLLILLAALLVPVRKAGGQVAEPPGELLHDSAEIRSESDPGAVRRLRVAIERLRNELERREERRDLIVRQERALHEVALATGLDTDLAPEPYREWLDRASAGALRLESLGALASDVRMMAAAQRAALDPMIAEERGSEERILRLTDQIRQMVAAIPASLSEYLTRDLDALRDALDQVHTGVEAEDLGARASRLESALAGLLRAGATGT